MKTAKEWSQLFSESLATTHPVTMEYIVDCAMTEAKLNAKKDVYEQVASCLKGHPYYFQPEIVDDIVAHIKLHPMVYS